MQQNDGLSHVGVYEYDLVKRFQMEKCANPMRSVSRDGSGLGESGYSSKPAPFGPGMDYTY